MLCKLHYTLLSQREFGPPVLALKDNKINERDPLKLIFDICNHIQFLISCGSLFPFPLLALATHDIFWTFGIFSIPEQVMGPYIHLGELGQL